LAKSQFEAILLKAWISDLFVNEAPMIANDLGSRQDPLPQVMTSVADHSLLNFLAGAGETAKLIAEFDWKSTSLGAIEDWPVTVKSTVALIVRSPVPIVSLWGEAGVMIYNDAYARFAGARHPSLLGCDVRDAWSEVADFNDNVMKVCLGGGVLSYVDQELTLHRDGHPSQVWMNLDYSAILDSEGRAIGVVAIVVETTERVLADRRIAAETERLRGMFDKAPGFMALFEGPQHVFSLANDSYLNLIGRQSQDSVLGRSVREALPEIAGQGFFELLDECYRSGNPHRGQSQRVVLHDQDHSLQERFLDFVYQPLIDSAGKVTGIFVEGADVTDRKRAEEALQVANANLERRVAERTEQLNNVQTFYTHSSECHAILTLREDGSFQYDEINPATLRLYGMEREQVIGRTADEIFGAEQAAHLNKQLTTALRKSVPYRYVRKHRQFTIEAIATPIPAEMGGRPRLAVTARDITERQSLEAQLLQAQKMEAVGQLTGGLAHDFNNLLATIIGSLELLDARRAQGRSSDYERYLGVAMTSSKRAAALTHRLLAFSRRQTLDATTLNINRLVTGMAELIRRTVGPQISLEVVSASDLWTTCADAGQLENSLLNLCINARDAMPDGGRLTVETANRWIDARAAREHDLTSGQYISMCVSDTGTGMTADVVARAFDPFFTTKPTGMGTGLGLSMVYGFAKQSGGQVRIYSEVGKGSMVCIYLPRLIATEEASDSIPTNIPLVKKESVNGKIMVVDDESNLRMVMSDVLLEIGYEVLEAHDGPSALRILDSGIDLKLLVTDVGLPGGMNGRQIADAARIRSPNLKVLFVTGYAENAAVGNGFVAPGMQVMTKPFSIDEFVRRVTDTIASPDASD
jgi:PAS domain S-box-containing protein